MSTSVFASPTPNCSEPSCQTRCTVAQGPSRHRCKNSFRLSGSFAREIVPNIAALPPISNRTKLSVADRFPPRPVSPRHTLNAKEHFSYSYSYHDRPKIQVKTNLIIISIQSLWLVETFTFFYSYLIITISKHFYFFWFCLKSISNFLRAYENKPSVLCTI